MVQAGFKVTHLSPNASGLPALEDRGEVRFIRIPNPFARFQPILKTGIAFAYRLPAVTEWSFLVSRWSKISGERFDLVVGHSSEVIYALRRTARFLGIPAISRLYGISATVDCLRKGFRRELYFDLISLLRNPPDHIILTNDGTCGDVAAHMFGIAPDRYNFLLNGYDPSLLKMRCIESSPPYVLTACRLVDWKRVDRVIRIAALCKDDLPELQFIILGDGPERPKLKKLVEQLDVGNTVHLMGRVPRVKMYEFLANASIVLGTQDLSNLNNTVLEAMVLGKPVVTLDTGCTRQLIHHGETGFLYAPHDLEGAARGIERIIRDRALGRALGRRAREFARKTLKPWPERVKQEADIYRKLIS